MQFTHFPDSRYDLYTNPDETSDYEITGTCDAHPASQDTLRLGGGR
jgi:hypothetical protein